MSGQKKRKLKLSNRGWIALGVITLVCISIVAFNQFTLIKANNTKITLNKKINYEFEAERLTMFIPINANMSDYKVWVGKHYFETDQTVVSQLLSSLDTSIPNEIVTTIVVDKTPLTISFIVE